MIFHKLKKNIYHLYYFPLDPVRNLDEKKLINNFFLNLPRINLIKRYGFLTQLERIYVSASNGA